MDFDLEEVMLTVLACIHVLPVESSYCAFTLNVCIHKSSPITTEGM